MKKEIKNKSRKRILAFLEKNYSYLKVRRDVLVCFDRGETISSDIHVPSQNLFIFISNSKRKKNQLYKEGLEILVLSPKDIQDNWKKVKKKINDCLVEDKHEIIKNKDSESTESEEILEENVYGGFLYSEQQIKKDHAERIDKLEKLDNQGAEINDLIGSAPGWLLRSGITIVAFVITIVLIFSSILKYPDKITCKAELTSTNPPTPIISNVDGYISNVLIENNAKVKKGDKIFYIRNTANSEHVNQFNDYVESIESGDLIDKIYKLEELQNLVLGLSLQPTYSQIILKIKEYKQVLGQNRTEIQLSTINREVAKLELLNQKMNDEYNIYDQELALIQKELNRKKELYAEGIVSQVELENAEVILNKYLRDEISIKQGNVQNDIRIEDLKLQKESLLEQRSESVNQFHFELLELISGWKTLYLEWQEKFYVMAESSGKMERLSSFGVNSKLNKNSLMGYIIPFEDVTEEKFIRAYAPSVGIGKVKVGSKAIIKLDAYPYKEYGLIISQVQNISSLTNVETQNQFFYELIIPLNDIVKTDHDFVVPFSPNMTGTVDVISEDRSILFRIMSEFIGLLKD